MQQLRCTGILLRPRVVDVPLGLPFIFEAALKTESTNKCLLRGELGSIAYELGQGDAASCGDELFDILESPHSLMKKMYDITRCLAEASSRQLASAIFRSRHYLEKKEGAAKRILAALEGDYREKRVDQQRVSDIGLVVALMQYASVHEAAASLCISHRTVWARLNTAAPDSLLRKYKPPYRKRFEITALALRRFGSQKAAAAALGIRMKTIAKRMRDCPTGSLLSIFQGTFVRGGRRGSVSEREIVVALGRYGASLEGVLRASRDLSISLSVLLKRMDDAPPDSSLSIYAAQVDRWWNEMGELDGAEMI